MSEHYRNVIEVEILSDEPWEENPGFGEIEYEITEGGSSGQVRTVIHNEELTCPQTRRALIRQGSDPEFLCQHTEEIADDPGEREGLALLPHLTMEELTQIDLALNGRLIALVGAQTEATAAGSHQFILQDMAKAINICHSLLTAIMETRASIR